MSIPTEPIGSIPRPAALLEGMRALANGRISPQDFDALGRAAVRDTIADMEATGSPVVTDGEQTKPSFVTYPIAGIPHLAPDGVTIPFADGHVRQLPRLTGGPFRYTIHAAQYLMLAKEHARVPVKQAVISASALSLLYPQGGIAGYSREIFLEDLLREHEADIRGCLQNGAHKVQIDFTADDVKERILEAAEFIPPSRLGTTDDCGFSPFGDDTSTSRETAFAKIHARVTGTALAAKALRV